jgi:mitochondrial inner membrane protein COX18
MMTLIHTQVPWYAAIPASAFLLRGALVTSFGTWARSLMARYISLQPLRQALARTKRDEVLKEMHKQGGARSPQEAKTRTMAEVKKVVAQLDSRWKVTLKGQIGWTLIQIPIFFTMAEVIRKMCGARDGLLALTASSVKGIKEWFTGSIEATTDASAATGTLEASDALSAPDALSITSALNDTTAATNVDGLAALATSPFFEHTLATEGMLWFPNLITPDPFLPFIVSGLMFSNIYFTKNAPTSDKNWPNAIRRVLLGVSLLIGPLCQNLPAGLMLYWAGSTTSVMVWNKWLDWKYPAPADFTACKRPLQMPHVMKSRTPARRI